MLCPFLKFIEIVELGVAQNVLFHNQFWYLSVKMICVLIVSGYPPVSVSLCLSP